MPLRTRRDFPLLQGFDLLRNQIVIPLCRRSGIVCEEEMLFYFVGFQASFTMILRRWADRHCKESLEQMAQVIWNALPFIWREQIQGEERLQKDRT